MISIFATYYLLKLPALSAGKPGLYRPEPFYSS
jgi:hypothetical protein